MPSYIQVFEHEILKIGTKGFTKDNFESLCRFHGENGCAYFSLINRGIKFCEFVGVIQIDQLTIEILPKIDKYEDGNYWRSVLISMLKSVGLFRIHSSGNSSLDIKHNSILDLYIELFVLEFEKLVHKGLLKKYRKIQSNSKSLNGALLFSKHISKNYAHKEKFYVSHTAYDEDHLLNQILVKTIFLLKRINTNPHLKSKIASLCNLVPDISEVKVSENIFSKIRYNRKTKSYKPAIDIAYLLLLNFHPDISKGKHHVLAIMFDMNLLWEKFVYVSLKKQLNGYLVRSQAKKTFWKSNNKTVSLQPDIILTKNDCNYVIDTKWKIVENQSSSIADLRQMYSYSHYFNADKTALLYPSTESNIIYGSFVEDDKTCNIIKHKISSNIADWQKNLASQIAEWIDSCFIIR